MTRKVSATNTGVRLKQMVGGPAMTLIASIAASDELIKSISFHTERSVKLRGDVLPFVVVYAVLSVSFLCFAAWRWLLYAIFSLMFGLHLVTFLSSFWSVRCMLGLRYQPCKSLESAEFVCAFPMPNCGESEIIRLRKKTIAGISHLAFEFQKITYVLDQNKKIFSPIPLPLENPLTHYLDSKGLSGHDVSSNRGAFGTNELKIPTRTFQELAKEHAVAPFFVFQMLCVTLWLLDEYWYYALLTLILLLLVESAVIHRRLKNLKDLLDMRPPPYLLWVFREGRWIEVMTTELVVGDVMSAVRTEQQRKGAKSMAGDQTEVELAVVPCDVIIVAGSCVVNEALLTGESVPQIKDSLADSDTARMDPTLPLDIKKVHRSNVLWGGTKIILQTPLKHPSIRGSFVIRHNFHKEGVVLILLFAAPPDGGCICVVLRTGFQTSQGSLVRTMLFSAQRVTLENNKESLLFIGVLLVFAILASGYVLYVGLQDEKRDRYKLLLKCIMIITSVVPPELPMELSLAVNNSLLSLAKEKVFCTEPFRIPLGGAVDVCCFDKTGTLTSDDLRVDGIAGLAQSESGICAIGTVVDLNSIVENTAIVLGGCHSLRLLSSGRSPSLIGDPMEQAAFAASGWAMDKNGLSVRQPMFGASKMKLRVLQRFQFSSSLKRMACIVSVEHTKLKYVVAKGAPEVMRPLFEDDSVPSSFKSVSDWHSSKGKRVLALGIKALSGGHGISRSQAESKLKFAGFLILSCPIKFDSKRAVEELTNSSHSVRMITGDHLMTACAVARQVGLTKKHCLSLDLTTLSEDGEQRRVSWNRICDPDNMESNGASFQPITLENITTASLEEIKKDYDICISGATIDFLLEGGVESRQFEDICCAATIFARTSPQHKEVIVSALKRRGKTVLMCGDGTNDVGALKQAHIGLALISGVNPRESAKYRHAVRAAWVRQDEEKRGEDRSKKSRPRKGEKKKTMKELLEDERKAQALSGPVRLGDASIASAFTSKAPYITSALHIIRQGRCTLVTTMQMFQILALNSLISAYSMSVLTMDGIKFGDTQMTVVGLFVAVLFLLISKSRPIAVLSEERPHRKLFSLPMLATISGQFAIHFWSLLQAVALSQPFGPRDEKARDPDGDFEPNVVNSTIFLISTSMTIATFVANYQGEPFMQSFRNNKALFKATIFIVLSLYICALEIFPAVNELMELAPFPSASFSTSLVEIMLIDNVACVVYAKMTNTAVPPHSFGPSTSVRSPQSSVGR